MQTPIKLWLKKIPRLPVSLAIAGIALYQTVLSPLKLFFFGAAGSCRFYPTCSSYARESLRRYGLVVGTGLAIWRLLKCHPFHPGGVDPVPQTLIRRRCDCRPAETSAGSEASETGYGADVATPERSFVKHG